MSKTASVTVDLTTGVAEEIDRAVRAGDYESASDVVRDALTLWQSSRDNAGFTDEEIVALWDEGIASGPGQFANFDELIAEAERRAASKI